MINEPGEMVSMEDDEVVEQIAIILAAYGEKLPQLKGRGVRPDTKDWRHRVFARELVDHLKMGSTRFFRHKIDSPLMLNTGCFKPHR
jgi:hypothetical protein